MDEIGVIHGRFQVLHNDHVKYLLAGKEKCNRLIIGICNPDSTLTKYTDSNPHRSKASANPLTYYEREECIRLAMIDAGVYENQFIIVPFPINYPERVLNYTPSNATFYLTIYDKWGEEKYNILRNQLGLKVSILRRTTLEYKGLSSSDIRKAIAFNQDWQRYVPMCVYNYIIDHKINLRIKNLYFKDQE